MNCPNCNRENDIAYEIECFVSEQIDRLGKVQFREAISNKDYLVNNFDMNCSDCGASVDVEAYSSFFLATIDDCKINLVEPFPLKLNDMELISMREVGIYTIILTEQGYFLNGSTLINLNETPIVPISVMPIVKGALPQFDDLYDFEDDKIYFCVTLNGYSYVFKDYKDASFLMEFFVSFKVQGLGR